MSERNLNFFAKQKRDETHMVLLNALSESSQSKTEYQTKRLYFNYEPSNGVTDIYICKLKHTVFFLPGWPLFCEQTIEYQGK